MNLKELLQSIKLEYKYKDMESTIFKSKEANVYYKHEFIATIYSVQIKDITIYKAVLTTNMYGQDILTEYVLMDDKAAVATIKKLYDDKLAEVNKRNELKRC